MALHWTRRIETTATPYGERADREPPAFVELHLDLALRLDAPENASSGHANDEQQAQQEHGGDDDAQIQHRVAKDICHTLHPGAPRSIDIASPRDRPVHEGSSRPVFHTQAVCRDGSLRVLRETRRLRPFS